MKVLFLSLTLLISILSLQPKAHAYGNNNIPNCPSTCRNQSNNSFYDNLCTSANIHGQKGCEKYAGLGCVYYQGQAVVSEPATCVNLGSQSIYNSLCQSAAAHGPRGCEKYSELGCTWQPARYACR